MMSRALHPISTLIRERRATFADQYTDEQIPKELIEEIVTNATWAPTHKLTQPWRFIVLSGNHPTEFGEYMVAHYKKKLTEKQFPLSRYQSTLAYPKNATLIAIIFQRSKRIEIPEWEEIAAISCAVQNMWLSCTAYDIGCYWDTCEAALCYGNALELAANEKCLGIFYMGKCKKSEQVARRKRKSIQKKLSWNHKK